jgi:hypothetical protein
MVPRKMTKDAPVGSGWEEVRLARDAPQRSIEYKVTVIFAGSSIANKI